jgi:hypothetical protein
MACCTTKATWKSGALHRYRWFHRSCLCPDASAGICVLSADQDLHDKKLFIKGKADQYPALQSLISTTSLNLKEIEIHWREVLRLATSIKQGTVTASLMLKKLASYPKQNGLAKALRKLAVLNELCLCSTGSAIRHFVGGYRRD